MSVAGFFEAAKVTERLWEMGDIVDVLEAGRRHRQKGNNSMDRDSPILLELAGVGLAVLGVPNNLPLSLQLSSSDKNMMMFVVALVLCGFYLWFSFKPKD